MSGIVGNGFMGRGQGGGPFPPPCGISYGSYLSTKAIKGLGLNDYLFNNSFSYNNSVTGYTILSAWFLNTATQVDFDYMLAIKNAVNRTVAFPVGTSNCQMGDGSSNGTQTTSVTTTQLVFCAHSYKPLSVSSSEGATSINNVSNSFFNATTVASNWNTATPCEIFKRPTGGNRSPGNCAFLQIIDQPLDEDCIAAWTQNRELRNLVGSFNDLVLLDIENELKTIGAQRFIEDISGNGHDFQLSGFTAAQIDPLNAGYCIVPTP